MLLLTRRAGAALILTSCLVVGAVPTLQPDTAAAAACVAPPVGTTAAVAGNNSGFLAVAPVRLVDTRSGVGAPQAPVEARCVLRVELNDASAPVGATAAVLTVTSAGAPRPTFLTVYACDSARPFVSHLNPRPSDPVPGLAIVPLNATRAACIYVDDTTEVLVDLTGWYAPAGSPLHELTPLRVLDTRSTPRTPGLAPGRPADATTIRIPLAGRALPAEARAVAAVVTLTNATQQTYATAAPCGSLPGTSTVNTLPGLDRGAPAMVGLDVVGDLCVYVDRSADVIVDITGWYGDDSPNTGVPLVVPGSPLREMQARRLADSRDGTGGWSTRFASGEVRSLRLLDAVSVGATAVQLEVIAVDATSAGYLTAYPCGTTPPTTSVVNFRAGATSAESSMVTVGLGAGGAVCLSSFGSTHVVVDLIAVHGTSSALRTLGASPGLDRPAAPGQPDHTVHCPAGGGPIRIAALAAPGATVSVDGGPAAASVDVQRPMAIDGIVTIDTAGPAGTARAYLRCLPPDFPALAATGVSPTPGWYRSTSLSPAPFAFILDEYGVPVWYKRTPYPVIGLFANGPNGLAWRNYTGGGFATEAANLGMERRTLDGSLVDTITLPTEPVDWHEFLRLANGNALVVVYSQEAALTPEPCADPFNVSHNATVIVNGDVVEVDPSGVEIWRWSSNQHVNISENTYPLCFDLDPGPPEVWGLDLLHINAVDVFPGGDLLVTARHFNAVMRVDRTTGNVKWKLGGTPPKEGVDLAVENDPRFGPVTPHDGRVLPNGNVTIHDNRFRSAQPTSRAVEYSIQPTTATLVWSYPATFLAGTLGSVRRLADGSTVMGWGTGTSPWFEQILADGTQGLTISVPVGLNIYRAEASPAAAFDRAVLRDAGGGAAPPA